MTIQINPKHEEFIRRAIREGLIGNPEDVVYVGVEAIQKQLENRSPNPAPVTPEQWLEEFHAWVNSHPTTTPLLSGEAISRESIYGTRG